MIIMRRLDEIEKNICKLKIAITGEDSDSDNSSYADDDFETCDKEIDSANENSPKTEGKVSWNNQWSKEWRGNNPSSASV